MNCISARIEADLWRKVPYYDYAYKFCVKISSINTLYNAKTIKYTRYDAKMIS